MEMVYEFYIRTTPEALWHAITDGETRARFNFGNTVSSDWLPGSRYELTNPRAPMVLGDGVNLEVDPPRRLVQSAQMYFTPEVAAEGTTRLTWEIEPVGDDACRLMLTHGELREDADPMLYGGWPMILSGLKTWLETGQELTTPGSLMYG